MPACAEPETANCAACETFSPRTSRVDERVPESFVLERLPRRAAIRSVLRIGDREAPQPAVGERGAQIRQRRIRLHGGAFRHEENDAARRVANAAVDGEALLREPADIVLVGGQKQFERRALLDLAVEIAR